MPRNRKLRLVCAAYGALAGAIAVMLPSQSVVSGIILIPLLCLAPGYSVLAAIWPARDFAGSHCAEAWLVSVLLSFALVVFGGLLLNLTAEGLTTRSWAIYLAAVTVVPITRRVRYEPSPRPRPRSMRRISGVISLVALTLALVSASVLIALRSAAHADQPHTSVLALAHSGNRRFAQIENRLEAPQRYTLDVITKGTTDVQHIRLGRNESASIPLPSTGPVRVELYRRQSFRPIRTVWTTR